jgi:hypothetical protein
LGAVPYWSSLQYSLVPVLDYHALDLQLQGNGRLAIPAARYIL